MEPSRSHQCLLTRSQEEESLFLSQSSNSGTENAFESSVNICQEPLDIDSLQNQDPKPFGGDAKLERLMNVYTDARQDFESRPQKHPSRTKAAMFLRDTIENCLEYLDTEAHTRQRSGELSTKSMPLEEDIKAEMKRVLRETSAAANQGCGGRKRSFEHDKDAVKDDTTTKRVKISLKSHARSPAPKSSFHPRRPMSHEIRDTGSRSKNFHPKPTQYRQHNYPYPSLPSGDWRTTPSRYDSYRPAYW